ADHAAALRQHQLLHAGVGGQVLDDHRNDPVADLRQRAVDNAWHHVGDEMGYEVVDELRHDLDLRPRHRVGESRVGEPYGALLTGGERLLAAALGVVQ